MNIDVKREKKNHEINIAKFIFAVIIVLFHSQYFFPKELRSNEVILFYNGSIAVEFFFIVSGYYFANSCLGGGKTPQGLMAHKIKAFLLPVWCSWIIAFVGTHIVQGRLGVTEIAKGVMKGIYEPLLIRNGGFVGEDYNGVVWYISAMLLTMGLIIIPLYKYKEKYIYIIAPVIAVFCLGYLSHKYKSCRNVTKWDGIMYKCQIRAIAEINLGIFLYGLKKCLDGIELTKLGKGLLTVLEGGIYLSVILFMHFRHISGMDFAVIILIAIAVLCSMTQKTYLADLACHIPSVADFLGKYSFYLYLNHVVCRVAVEEIFTERTYAFKLIPYICSALMLAFIVMRLVDVLTKQGPRVRRLFIKT
ncbi:MAG: acyltransferase [Clostridium sp.]|nr:acyltransferase [Clostridium sp.]